MDQPQAMKVPIEQLREDALKHYEKASSAIHCWSSFVEKAIKAYNPINQDLSECSNACDWPNCTQDNCADKKTNQEGSLKDSDWKEKFNSEMQEKFESWCYRHTGLDRHEIDNIIEYFVEEVFPLLQNEYEGDDLVSSVQEDSSLIVSHPSGSSNSIGQKGKWIPASERWPNTVGSFKIQYTNGTMDSYYIGEVSEKAKAEWDKMAHVFQWWDANYKNSDELHKYRKILNRHIKNTPYYQKNPDQLKKLNGMPEYEATILATKEYASQIVLEVDTILAGLEDYLHGEEGVKITEARKKLNRITEPQKEMSQEKPHSSNGDGQQNPSQLKEATEIDFTIKGNTELCSSDGLLIQQNKTSNSEATILSAEQILKKHYDFDEGFTNYEKNCVLAAMEEYKNQEVQLLNK